MEEIIKQILLDMPATGILLLINWRIMKVVEMLFSQWQDDRKEAKSERQMLIDLVFDVKRRAEILEVETTGERSPTLLRKPDS